MNWIMTWGIWKNTLTEQILILLTLALVLWITFYLIYDTHFSRWTCHGCKSVVKGKIGPRTGFVFSPYCEGCVFKHINHAQYNRAFGVQKPLRVICGGKSDNSTMEP